MQFAPDLTLVDRLDAALELRRWLGERRDVLAIDTETSGLRWWDDVLRLVQVGDREKAWAIPWDGWQDFVREILNNYDGQMCMHNHKFDVQFLWKNGIDIPRHRLDCTRTQAHLVRGYGPTALKSLAKSIVPNYAHGERYLKQVMQEGKWDWGTVPITHQAYWAYGALDCVLTAVLWHEYSEVIDKDAKLKNLYRVEMGSQFAMTDMERRGIKVDLEYLHHAEEQLSAYVKSVEDWALQNYSIDIRSNAQLIRAMQRDGWQPTVLTPTGRPSLAKEALATIDHPLGQAYSELKHQEKVLSSYVRNIMSFAAEDGTIHCNMNPLGAVTGRMSVTDPALQTLPRTKQVRHAFMARPGKKLILVDYDQMELRLIAHYARDPKLIEACNQPDVHTTTAQQIYRKEVITAEERQITKNATYTIAYGGGPKKLAETAKIEFDQARDFMASYLDTFHGIRQLQDYMYQEAPYDHEKLLHYIRTDAGRYQWADKQKRYKLVNYLIQGTGADVIKTKIDQMQYDDVVGDTMLLPVHDEVVFEADEEDAQDVLERAIEIMTDDRYNPVLTVSGDIVDRWGDKYE